MTITGSCGGATASCTAAATDIETIVADPPTVDGKCEDKGGPTASGGTGTCSIDDNGAGSDVGTGSCGTEFCIDLPECRT